MPEAQALWMGLRGSWVRSLRARGMAPKTIDIYGQAADLLIDALPPGLSPDRVTRGDIEAFLEGFAAGTTPPSRTGKPRSPAYVNQIYRSLQQWMGWLVEEGEVDTDPMARMHPPLVPERPVPVLTTEQLQALLADCAGRRLVDRRDLALIRMMIDTGGRLAEISGLRVDDVDLDEQVCQVTGKGRRERTLPFGTRTAEALDRYLRARRADRHASAAALWLGERSKGPLTANGVYQAIKRRGRAVGIPEVHPHQFRHTSSHRWLLAGGGETDLMQLNGWKSRSMLNRYAASAAAARARDAHRRLALGDEL